MLLLFSSVFVSEPHSLLCVFLLVSVLLHRRWSIHSENTLKAHTPLYALFTRWKGKITKLQRDFTWAHTVQPRRERRTDSGVRSNSQILEEAERMDRERGREESLGVINQSTCPDSRQSAADIKVLSCQGCFTAYSTDERVEAGEGRKGTARGWGKRVRHWQRALKAAFPSLSGFRIRTHRSKSKFHGPTGKHRLSLGTFQPISQWPERQSFLNHKIHVSFNTSQFHIPKQCFSK